MSVDFAGLLGAGLYEDINSANWIGELFLTLVLLVALSRYIELEYSIILIRGLI
jgi:hypothetical protein